MKNNITLVDALELLKERKISSYDLVKYYSDKISKNNEKINAYLTINQNALNIAKKIKNVPDRNKPLLGIPIAVKDIFLTKGLRTTASSKLLDEFIPLYSATVVEKLEKAGAIILGKTNLDAWCHGSSTETSDYKPTRNPWNIDHIPGGSSGGSAAAVSADMAICAIGTETAGSIRGPAAWCGVVGFKPTYGRVSRYGVIAMGSSLDSPGPITKTVHDTWVILNVIAGKDIYDATTSELKKNDYVREINIGIKGMKIGIASEYMLPEMDVRVRKIIYEAAKVFEKSGAVVDEVKTLNPKYAIGVYTVVQRSEVSSNLSRFDGIRYGKNRNYFGQEAKRRIMLGTFTLSSGYQDKYYKKAQKVRTLYIEDFKKIFKKWDLLIAPTMPGPAPKLGATEGKAMFGEMSDVLTEPTSVSGLPGISVPCGFLDNLPLGLNIFGPQFSEAEIIRAASEYESKTLWHKIHPDL